MISIKQKADVEAAYTGAIVNSDKTISLFIGPHEIWMDEQCASEIAHDLGLCIRDVWHGIDLQIKHPLSEL